MLSPLEGRTSIRTLLSSTWKVLLASSYHSSLLSIFQNKTNLCNKFNIQSFFSYNIKAKQYESINKTRLQTALQFSWAYQRIIPLASLKHFPYYAIQCLVRVTDTEGNVTTSTYDMCDRRTEVNHPASGITSFTYDALGNVLTKQTANLAKEGKFITYDYDYQHLTGINYPDYLENNVKYYITV